MTTQQTAAQAVKQSLESGAETAAKIRAMTGLPHETVYSVLVHLEAMGLARLVCAKSTADNKVVMWGAL